MIFLRIHIKLAKKTYFSSLQIVFEVQGAYEEEIFQSLLNFELQSKQES